MTKDSDRMNTPAINNLFSFDNLALEEPRHPERQRAPDIEKRVDDDCGDQASGPLPVVSRDAAHEHRRKDYDQDRRQRHPHREQEKVGRTEKDGGEDHRHAQENAE